MIEDPSLPISSFNYSAIRDRLRDRGIDVSLPTIIDRAKALGCHRSRPKKKAHDREVITTAVGALIQHDASFHRWSPYAESKWTLISSLDDYGRKLLFADFFEHETTWAHLQAAEALTRRYGLPLQYYVDSLRVFRYVHSRDSAWYKTVLRTDDIDPQWKLRRPTPTRKISFAFGKLGPSTLIAGSGSIIIPLRCRGSPSEKTSRSTSFRI